MLSSCSLLFRADQDLDAGPDAGLDGADEQCQTRAGIANLPGEFRAWLSTASDAPTLRFEHHDGPYTLVGGTMLAANWDDLVDGALMHELSRTEFGAPLTVLPFVCGGGEVWTNTTIDGESASERDCDGWESKSSDFSSGAVGNVRTVDLQWTTADCGAVSCASRLPLYCFQQ